MGFTGDAGSLSPGANSGEVQVTITKYDGSNYNQADDYSFDPGMTDFGRNLHVAGYVNGRLVFGTEPEGSGTTPAPTPTATTVSTPTPTPMSNATLGDVNDDGSVDIVDALLVAQYYVGLSPSNFNPDAADTNCDNNVDIVDALLVAQYYVGLLSGFC